MQDSYLDSSIPDSEETLDSGTEDVFLFPLSFAQQRLWFLQQMNPQSPAYNMPVASRLLGKLNVKALEQALNEIVQRHEVLRTTFQMIDAQPMQVISSHAALVLPLLDLTHLPETARETEAHHLAVENLREPFDLVNGPLMRAALLRLNVEDHLLLLAMHHIISDGWSISVLVNELAALYNSFSIGTPATLPNLPIQYADYAQWQRSWLTGEVFEAQLDYWKKRLDGAPPILEVPTDRPRPAIESSRGSLEHFIVAEDVVRGLRELGKQEGATMFMVLLAAFQTLLHRYARQDVIVVGTPIAGRNRKELEGLIGFFINTLVMRADFSDDLRFRQLLAQVKETALGAYAHQEFPFDKLVEELQPQRDLSHMPIIQAMFALQNTPDESIELKDLTIKSVNIESGTTQFDLSLNIWDKGPALKGYLGYRSDLFDANTINRMLAHFQILLESIANYPDERVSLDGEALEPASLRDWMERHGDAQPRLINMYGITETTDNFFEPALRSSFRLPFSDSEQPLVSIQPQGSLSPFFCVHAVGGNVFSYVSLARRLGPAQPFYALQARGLMGGQEPHTRVEAMATDYIHAIRTVQEGGPYVLGGWSMGGLVAFEMACQLRQQGQQVALVILFDSITPFTARFKQENEQAMQVANFAFQLGLPATELANISAQLLSLDEESQLKHLFKLAQRSEILPKGFNLTQLHHLFKVYRSNNEAVLAYRPRACAAPLVLFRAAETMDDELTDTTYGWSRLAKSSLEIEVVRGNHFTMLDEPHVSLLVQKLRVHLAQASLQRRL